MGIIEDWGIDRKIHTCDTCGKEIPQEVDIMSGLYEENDSFIRRDFCLGCWSEQLSEASFSHWRTKHSVEKKVNPFVDDEVIFAFFEKLSEETEGHKTDFRYVLSLMLMRKRWLKLTGIDRNGENVYMLLRCPKNNSHYKVEERALSPEEMENLNEEVLKLFSMQVE